MPMQIDREEALRYAGVREENGGVLHAQIEEIARACEARIQPRYVWRLMELRREGTQLFLAEMPLEGQTARKMLAQCHHAAVLVCTLGASFDAWEKQVRARDMAQGLLLNACGSAYVEAGCDAAEAEIRSKLPGKYLTDRFSPGYGDLPLSCQKTLLAWTDAMRRLGITLTDSQLMNPMKSVTAIIGIADTPQAAKIRGCAYCALRERCTLRKGGKTCGE